MAPLVLSREGPPGPSRPGSVIGRVIEPGARGKPLEGVTVKLDGRFTYLTAVTDSTGAFRLTTPKLRSAVCKVQLELTGYEYDGYMLGSITIYPDSVIRLPDLIMWPVRYFDWATYKEFMSAPSVEVRSMNLRATASQDRDSTLLVVYRHYLYPPGPLVVRIGITPPWRDLIAEQAGVEAACLPGPDWPDIKEYGKYLLVDKGSCRFMQVQMREGQTGMRIWDVDSVVPGLQTKGGWVRGTAQSLGRSTMDGLRIYLHPYGKEFIGSRGVWTYLSDRY